MTTDKLRDRLTRRLDERTQELIRLGEYAKGHVPLEYVAPEIRKSAEGRLQTLSVPWPRLVLSAIEERLAVTGFRTARDDQTNEALWRVWQLCNMDELSSLAHVEALTFGRSFALVWADDAGSPTISVESARQCEVMFDPASRRVIAGVKRWVSDGRGHAVVFTPTEVRRYRSNADTLDDGSAIEGVTWHDTPRVIPNPLGVVPLVPLVNRPTISNPHGTSELADLLPLFDAMAKLSTDMLVTSEHHAAPRRWASGLILEESRDEETDLPTGEVEEGHRFSDLPGRLWVAEDAQARFGQFGAADLTSFVNALSMLKRDLSSTASLPPHYVGMFGDQPSSADAIRSAEASLVATCRRKTQQFAEGWEQVMRIAHAVSVGHWSPDLANLQTQWANVETRTEAQSMDAASKGVSVGVLDPDFAAERYLDMTPQEVTRNSEARRRRVAETVAQKALGA